MLRHDVRYSMPPWEGLLVGRDAVVADWTANGFPEMTGLRAVPTAVNRQPAVAYYLWSEEQAAHLPLTIDVLRVAGDLVTEVTIFGAERFESLGLPERLPAEGGER